MISVNLKEQLEIIINVDIIDRDTSIPLLDLISDAVRKSHGNVLIDLRNVSVIDSSGIAMLVRAIQRNSLPDRSISLVNASESVKTIFRIMNLDGFFKLNEFAAKHPGNGGSPHSPLPTRSG